MKQEVWHRHLGAYGICVSDGKLLVIRKNGGPYTGRYDLPGGSLEPLESLQEAVVREFFEESGVTVQVRRCLGMRDYIVAWTREGFSHTHCHHIALLYEAAYMSGNVEHSPNVDDSRGAEWVETAELKEDEMSPLVRDAVRWIRNGVLSIEPERLDDWRIREEA